jgi:hypothetical protein
MRESARVSQHTKFKIDVTVSLVVIICFRSHFVTTRGIDLKLCTCVPLGDGTYQTEILSAQILDLATRRPKLKKQKVL